MTCIVGISTGNTVVIGGDSSAVSSNEIRMTKILKVFNVGELIFGFTDSFRLGQILRYSTPIFQPQSQDPLTFLVTEFIEYLRELFEMKKFGKLDGEDGQVGGTFLVGYRGQLFTVERDFQVNCFTDGCVSVGAGAEYALGALHSMPKNMSLKNKVLKALDAASYFSPYVCGPYTLLGSKQNGDIFIP